MKIRFFLLSSAIFAILPTLAFAAPNGLVIDEFQIGKTGFSTDEYINIYNSGSSQVLLDGYMMTKKTSLGTEYKIHLFPVGANFYIQPKTQITLAHKTGYMGTGDHIDYSNSYSISADNTIYLSDANEVVVDKVGLGEDAFEYEKLPIADVHSNDVWQRTNGIDTDNNKADFTNVNAPKPLEIDSNAKNLLITELLPNPEEGEEWIEIYNPTSRSVSLNGLKLCDVVGRIHCFSFAIEEYISAFSYKSFDQSKTRITLNNDGDGAQILDNSDGVIYETALFEDSSEGESFSLFGSAWKWTLNPTENASNVFVSTVEEEKENKKSTKNISVKPSGSTENEQVAETEDTAVKAAENVLAGNGETGSYIIGKKEIGWAAIALAIILLLGYTIREQGKNS